MNLEVRIPPLNGLPLWELAALGVQREDPNYARRFLSCLHQEISASAGNDDGDEEEEEKKVSLQERQV